MSLKPNCPSITIDGLSASSISESQKPHVKKNVVPKTTSYKQENFLKLYLYIHNLNLEKRRKRKHRQ